MQNHLMLTIALATALFITGCEKKLDTSSQEAFKKSVDEISKDLDAAKKEKFETAITVLMMHEVVFSEAADEAAMKKKMDAVFSGKTVDEIISAGEKVQAKTKDEIEKMMK